MKHLKRFNENIDESGMDSLEEYEFFMDESRPNSPIYHEYRIEIEPDDAYEYSVWTPKGNVEIIVMDKECLDWNKKHVKYRRLGEMDDVIEHYMRQKNV